MQKETRNKRYARNRNIVQKQIYFKKSELELYVKAHNIQNFSEWVKNSLRGELTEKE